jgi:DNA-directed RNA polymerase III subunit RPC1
MKLMQILEVNNVIKKGLEDGLGICNLMENWDFLQVQCAMYINDDLPGLPPTHQTTGKPLRCRCFPPSLPTFQDPLLSIDSDVA